MLSQEQTKRFNQFKTQFEETNPVLTAQQTTDSIIGFELWEKENNESMIYDTFLEITKIAFF